MYVYEDYVISIYGYFQVYLPLISHTDHAFMSEILDFHLRKCTRIEIHLLTASGLQVRRFLDLEFPEVDQKLV
jgi:hypothetical protein